MTVSRRVKAIGTVSIAMIAFGLTALVLALFVGPLGASSDSRAPRAPTTSQEPPKSLSVLGQPQDDGDLLPNSLAIRAPEWGESGVSNESTRLLGSDKAGRYWAALDNSGNVCVIIETPSEGFASACQTAQRFEKYGVDLRYQVANLGTFSEIYLVPDGLDLTSPPKGLHAIGDNLLSGDTRRSASMNEAVEVSGERNDFELHLIGPEPKD